MAGWGDFFGKIGQQFAGRIERMKNEKAKLLIERQKIMESNVTSRSADRIIAIDERVRQINEAISNKASD